jgi:methyltransferase (TIGR00027 family)
MLEDAPSRTAFRVALRRAAHQVLDKPPVFADPLAIPMVGASSADIESDPRNHSVFGRALRAFMAARSRWAEHRLSDAVNRGVFQYVILGAGLDTFAFRNPFPQLRIFEVDHPATQAFKRERADAAGFLPTSGVTYVAIDFEKQALAAALAANGFDSTLPAFFSWLGVVPYLELAATAETLRFVASVATPVEVVFDYAVDPALLSAAEQAAVAVLADRVAAAGEPFRAYFVPGHLHAQLRQMGFDVVDELGPDEINQLYFNGRRDGLRLRGRAARVLSARRTGSREVA